MRSVLLAILCALSFSAHAQLAEVGSENCFDNSGAGWGGSAQNIAVDGNVASGDLILTVLAYYENNSSDAPTTPSGHTERVASVVSGTGDTEGRLYAWTKVSDGMETVVPIERSGAADPWFGSACVIVFRGDSALSFVSATAGTPSSGVASIDAPSVSGTAGQGLILVYDLDNAVSTGFTEPMGTTAAATSTTTGTAAMAHVAYDTLESTAATGAKTLSWTGGNDTAIGVSILVDGAESGASAPTISDATPSGTLGTTTTATLGATSDDNTGTFYGVVDTDDLTGITGTQVKAGQDAGGGATVADCNDTVSTTSPSCGVTGLTADTAYNYALVHNTATGDSNVLTGTFTTAATAITPQAMHLQRLMNQN